MGASKGPERKKYEDRRDMVTPPPPPPGRLQCSRDRAFTTGPLIRAAASSGNARSLGKTDTVGCARYHRHGLRRGIGRSIGKFAIPPRGSHRYGQSRARDWPRIVEMRPVAAGNDGDAPPGRAAVEWAISGLLTKEDVAKAVYDNTGRRLQGPSGGGRADAPASAAIVDGTLIGIGHFLYFNARVLDDRRNYAILQDLFASAEGTRAESLGLLGPRVIEAVLQEAPMDERARGRRVYWLTHEKQRPRRGCLRQARKNLGRGFSLSSFVSKIAEF